MATLSSPTLQQLLTSVRTMLSQPKESNSTWKDIELSEYLNEAVRVYFTECVLVNEGYFTTQTDLNIVNAAETVTLPADCFQIKNLYKKVSDGYRLLPYRNSVTADYSTVSTSSADSYFPAYSFRGSSIVLHPVPNFSESSGLRIEYIQFPDQMVWGGDSLTSQVSPIFKQIIVMYAVYKAKLRESLVSGVNTYGVAKENLGELYTLFKDTIQRRSRNPIYVIPFSPDSEG